MNVLVVESPAKAKTINKYLGDNYKVLASFGHIRDLPSKDGSVKPDHSGNSAGTWTFDGGAGKLKGLTGKGTYKDTYAADGTGTSQIEGEYKLP